MNQREHEQEEVCATQQTVWTEGELNKQTNKLLKEMCHFLPFKYVYFDTRKLITVVILSDFFWLTWKLESLLWALILL